MSSMTYEAARRAGTPAPSATTTRESRGFWSHVFDRLVESRQRQALEEIHRHGHLLPRELEQAGWKVDERSEDSLPFVR